MSKEKTFPGAATGAQTQQPAEQGADAVLASAAHTAQPGALPKVEKQPPDIEKLYFTPPEVIQAIHGEQNHPPIEPVYSMERARALPELHQDAYVPFESDDPKAILAFKEEDGRTMRVAVALNCLAKIELKREPAS